MKSRHEIIKTQRKFILSYLAGYYYLNIPF